VKWIRGLVIAYAIVWLLNLLIKWWVMS